MGETGGFITGGFQLDQVVKEISGKFEKGNRMIGRIVEETLENNFS